MKNRERSSPASAIPNCVCKSQKIRITGLDSKRNDQKASYFTAGFTKKCGSAFEKGPDWHYYSSDDTNSDVFSDLDPHQYDNDISSDSLDDDDMLFAVPPLASSSINTFGKKPDRTNSLLSNANGFDRQCASCQSRSRNPICICANCRRSFFPPVSADGGNSLADRNCASCIQRSATVDNRSFRSGYRWGLQSAALKDAAAPLPPQAHRFRFNSAFEAASDYDAPTPHSSAAGGVKDAVLRDMLADSERRILAAVDDRAAVAEREAAARAEALRASLRGVRDCNEDLRQALGGIVDSLRADLLAGPPGPSGPEPASWARVETDRSKAPGVIAHGAPLAAAARRPTPAAAQRGLGSPAIVHC